MLGFSDLIKTLLDDIVALEIRAAFKDIDMEAARETAILLEDATYHAPYIYRNILMTELRA